MISGRNVEGDGFEYGYRYWRGNYRPAIMTIPWLVLEVGTHSIAGTAVRAATVTAGDEWAPVSLPDAFTETPVVLASRMSVTDPVPAAVRLHDVSPGGFAVRLQPESNGGGSLSPETLHYVAIEPVETDVLQAGTVSVDGSRLYPESVYADFDLAPLAQIQTFDDPAPATPNHVNRLGVDPEGTTPIEVRITGESTGVPHGRETVGWFATDPGPLEET